jgi:hypothetical protein
VHEGVALDEVTDLGFSAVEILQHIEGAHAGVARWRDPCAPGVCVAIENGCPRHAPSFAGTTTTLRIDVEHTGEEATLARCREGEPGWDCGELLQIPVRVSLATDDGLLDERFETEIGALEAQGAAVGGELRQLSGSLREVLPSVAYVEWNLGLAAERARPTCS